MNVMKKTAAVFLALVLLLGMACVPATAEDVPLITEGQWYAYLEAGGAAICAFIPERTTQYYVGSYVSGVPESQYVVLDENGELIKHAKSGMYLTMNADETYFIAIGFWSESQSGRIDFHIYDSAKAITADPSASYSDSFLSEEYVAWYTFTPDRTHRYTLQSTGDKTGYSLPTVTLYDSKGHVVKSVSADATSEGFLLSALLHKDNTYYYKLEYNMNFYTGACPVTLKAERYPDVDPNEWYYDAAEYVSTRGYMAGFANGYFGPAANMQRQDFVLILARVAGVDLEAYKQTEVTMPDVVAGSYYAAAVAWAAENGVVSGYNNGKFGVGDPITREQVCTILYRFVGSPEMTDVDDTLARFPDKENISDYAKIPTAWAVQNGVMSGMASGYMAPVAKASRAQVAVIVTSMHKQGMFEVQ